MEDRFRTDLDIESEISRIKRRRETAESSESPSKPEDYVVLCGKYRAVRPYFFDFVCSVKQRNAGLGIIDIFCKEFPARSRSYYTTAFAMGALRIEGQPDAKPDSPLAAGAIMRHLVHRHEPVTTADLIPVLGDTDDMVAVSKPAGMPVHVAGQYRKNTVLGILEAERPDLGVLYPVHRLDKPVSGVLIFAKSPLAANALRLDISDKGNVEKLYIARVEGRFPGDGKTVVADADLSWDPCTNHATAHAKMHSSPPSITGASSPPSSPKQKKARKLSKAERVSLHVAKTKEAVERSVNKVAAPAKPSLTHFRLLDIAPDGTTSLVECQPLTGRTHQIRAHLAWLGHPIANDVQYGGKKYPGPNSTRATADDLGVKWTVGHSTEERVTCGSSEELLTEAQVPPELQDPLCIHCPYYFPLNYPMDVRPLWLHALRYSKSGSPRQWSFEAPLPSWALKDWIPTPFARD